jgi:hypothetical protein
MNRNCQIRMTNPAIAHQSALRHSGFGFLSSFVICHSDFRQPALARCSPIGLHFLQRCAASFGGALNSHCSPKNPAFAIPPGAREETGTVISTIAQSGSFGT